MSSRVVECEAVGRWNCNSRRHATHSGVEARHEFLVDRRKTAAYKLYPRDGVVSGPGLHWGTLRRARLQSCCMPAFSHTSC
jgi:hypothetical protein